MNPIQQAKLMAAKQRSADRSRNLAMVERALKKATEELDEERTVAIKRLLKINRLEDRIEELEGGVHLNSESLLPPVDCPLLIRIPTGALVKAQRDEWLSKKDGEIAYRLYDNSIVRGRFRWTYP